MGASKGSDSATSRRAAIRKGLDRRWADFLGFWAGLEHFRIRIGLSFLAMRHRMGFSAEERRLRSQLHRLLDSADAFARGSLIEMQRCCGRPACHCALKGKKHRSLYLGQSQQGKPRMKSIAKDQEQQVRRWVANYQRASALLEALSQHGWLKLNRQKKATPGKEKDTRS